MRNERSEGPAMLNGAFNRLIRDPERLARFYAEAAKLSTVDTLDCLFKRVAHAARSLAAADTAKVTLADFVASKTGGTFWATNGPTVARTTLEREICAGGRCYATLRVTTSRPHFLAEDEALVDLLCAHASLTIERLAFRDAEQLLDHVRNLLWQPGLTPPDATIRECGEIRLDLGSYQAFVANRPIHLTLSEFRLLELLTEEPGRAYTRYEIANRLWGTDSASSLRIADAHVSRLRRKIERDPARPRRLQSVRGIGYRLVVDAGGSPRRT